MRLAPTHIEIIGDLFAIRWSDGTESFIPLEDLRRACPCAGCGGEPDVLGRVVRPEAQFGTGSFQLRRYDMIGGYAIQPTWADDHNTGLYTYTYLKRLGEVSARTEAGT